eukprot:scaffold36470_cov79-Phaeocystis_antarctica.AAC.2
MFLRPRERKNRILRASGAQGLDRRRLCAWMRVRGPHAIQRIVAPLAGDVCRAAQRGFHPCRLAGAQVPLHRRALRAAASWCTARQQCCQQSPPALEPLLHVQRGRSVTVEALDQPRQPRL